jgi:hypothetical protein
MTEEDEFSTEDFGSNERVSSLLLPLKKGKDKKRENQIATPCF